MTALQPVLWLGLVLFTWTGCGCFVGIARFKYWPLAILGTGYLCWVGSMSLLVTSASTATGGTRLAVIVILLGLGAILVFGYRMTYYPKMRAQGIHPRNIFGFGAGEQQGS